MEVKFGIRVIERKPKKRLIEMKILITGLGALDPDPDDEEVVPGTILNV